MQADHRLRGRVISILVGAVVLISGGVREAPLHASTTNSSGNSHLSTHLAPAVVQDYPSQTAVER